MPLEVITGRANSGKSGAAYARLERAISSGKRATLVLPSIPDVDRARPELSRRMPLGLGITTLGGMINARWDEYGDGRRIVSSNQRSALLELICTDLDLSPALAKLASLCVNALADQTGERWRRERRVPPPAGRLLHRVLCTYATQLSSLDLLEEAEAAHLLGHETGWADECIVFHRFEDVSQAHVALVEGARRANEVVLTLSFDPGVPATRAMGRIIDVLSPDIQIDADTANFYTNQDLTNLSERLFSPNKDVRERVSSIRFGLAQGSRGEADLVLRAVVDHMSQGTKPEEIAVVFRDAATRYRELKRAFDDGGVRGQFDVVVSLRSTAFGAAFVAALEFATHDDRAAALALLRSPFCGIPAEAVVRIEQQWRKSDVSDPRELLRSIAGANRELADQLTRLRRACSGVMTGAELQQLAHAACWMHACGCEANTQEDDAARRAVLRVVDELIELDGARVTADAVLRLLSDTEVAQTGAERPGHVQVMSAVRLRGRRFRTVIIAGLNAGEFPPVPAEMMLPGSAVDAVLRSFGGRAPDVRGPEYEEALFYECFTKARDSVVLVARVADDDGETERISSFFEEVADFFREEDGALRPDMEASAGEPPSKTSARARDRLRAQLLEEGAIDARGHAASNRARSRAGALSEERVFEIPEVFSATQIESYLSCPYRWFHQHAVRPRDLERTYDVRSEGEYAHRILAEAYGQFIAREMMPLCPANVDKALEVLREAIHTVDAASGRAGSVEEEVGRQRARTWAERIIAEDSHSASGLVTRNVEWEFGTVDDPLDMGGFLLVGRIDRVDVDLDGNAVVTDYKRSTKSSHGAAKTLDEGGVQLALYLAAVMRRLGLKPVAGIYRGLSKPGERGMYLTGYLMDAHVVRGDRLSEEDFEKLVDDSLAMARGAVEGIRRADIAPRPLTANSCLKCPIRDTCRAAQ